MMRVVIYARYSSDKQSEASIVDQVRLCQAYADKQGWRVVETHGDRAISGATLLRPGYQAVMAHAMKGETDIVLAESLDRLSRDQEETAALFKRLRFLRVELITVAEGQITELHVGLKGTMNALYLKDLADKTRRGLEGRVRAGRSGGGICYGYDVVDERDGNGDPVRGGRTINTAEANVVRRVFAKFSAGHSPRAIAHALNREGIPGPSGRTWGPSTLYGNWRRGTGFLNNELYIGRMVWNRLRYVKDPSTGKRVSQLNPEADWIVQEVPDLRIIDDALWQQVKMRQQGARSDVITAKSGIRPERARRPAYLLSGLLKCGVCGGGFSKVNRDHYGCSTARNKGTCVNLLVIRRDHVEERVLDGLKHHLMRPDMVKLFVEEFNTELNRLWAEKTAGRTTMERELATVTRDLEKLVDAITAGVAVETIRERIMDLEARKTILRTDLARAPEPMPALHPNIAEIYRKKVADLANALNDPPIRQEASEALRALIEEVRLIPEDGALRIELFGELSALLALGRSRQSKHPRAGATGVQTSVLDDVQVTLVAGRGFEPLTFRL